MMPEQMEINHLAFFSLLGLKPQTHDSQTHFYDHHATPLSGFKSISKSLLTILETYTPFLMYGILDLKNIATYLFCQWMHLEICIVEI